MSSISMPFYKTSIGNKVFMAATGLFLCLFLVGHLAGNLQLFIAGEEGRLQFNAYAKFMTSNPAVKILSYLTYASILYHAFKGFALTRKNKKARPVEYDRVDASTSSHWTSRNMALLGTIVLIFIILHMRGFWYVMHFGELGLDSAGNKDLYTIVIDAFQQWYIVLIYTLAMFGISFHLWHGFKSAFMTLGLFTNKTGTAFAYLGYGFAVIIPLAFATIPIYLYLN